MTTDTDRLVDALLEAGRLLACASSHRTDWHDRQGLLLDEIRELVGNWKPYERKTK